MAISIILLIIVNEVNNLILLPQAPQVEKESGVERKENITTLENSS